MLSTDSVFDYKASIKSLKKKKKVESTMALAKESVVVDEEDPNSSSIQVYVHDYVVTVTQNQKAQFHVQPFNSQITVPYHFGNFQRLYTCLIDSAFILKTLEQSNATSPYKALMINSNQQGKIQGSSFYLFFFPNQTIFLMKNGKKCFKDLIEVLLKRLLEEECFSFG